MLTINRHLLRQFVQPVVTTKVMLLFASLVTVVDLLAPIPEDRAPLTVAAAGTARATPAADGAAATAGPAGTGMRSACSDRALPGPHAVIA